MACAAGPVAFPAEGASGMASGMEPVDDWVSWLWGAEGKEGSGMDPLDEAACLTGGA